MAGYFEADELSTPISFYQSASRRLKARREGAGRNTKPFSALPPPPTEEVRDTYDRLIAMLRKEGVEFTTLSHAPTKTSQESADVRGVSLASGAKAMMFRMHLRHEEEEGGGGEGKGGKRGKGGSKGDPDFVLTVMSAAKKLDLKKVKKVAGARSGRSQFAAPEEVFHVTKCLSGAVPPFGRLFPLIKKTILDPSLIEQGETINFNAGLRTESVGMPLKHYLRIQNPIIAPICQEEDSKDKT